MARKATDVSIRRFEKLSLETDCISFLATVKFYSIPAQCWCDFTWEASGTRADSTIREYSVNVLSPEKKLMKLSHGDDKFKVGMVVCRRHFKLLGKNPVWTIDGVDYPEA